MNEPSTAPRGRGPGMPRWVKVFAIVGAVVLVLLVVMLLTGHGPGRHMQHGLSHLAPGLGGAGW
jgi:hypothetical protein